MAGAAPPVAARVEAAIAREGLLAAGDPVLAMLSGGADSTLLVVLLAELGHEVAALHVAHGLRGAASEGDVAACAELCAGLGVPLAIVAGAEEPGANLEARLRARRQAAARGAAAGRTIATGHTASDRVETVLYRLATSGGVRALPALRYRERDIVRPLLELERDEVRAELARRGVPWREDASNADLRFARNRIRHEVVPVLEDLNPRAVANLARAAALAADERDFVDAAATALLDAGGALDLVRLRSAHVAVQRAAVRLAAERAGVEVGHRDVEALRGLGSAGGEERSLRGGLAYRSYDCLTFARAGAAVTVPPAAALPVPGELPFGPYRVLARLGAGEALDAASRISSAPPASHARCAPHFRSCCSTASRSAYRASPSPSRCGALTGSSSLRCRPGHERHRPRRRDRRGAHR